MSVHKKNYSVLIGIASGNSIIIDFFLCNHSKVLILVYKKVVFFVMVSFATFLEKKRYHCVYIVIAIIVKIFRIGKRPPSDEDGWVY